jgi:hypothetical protein
MNKKVFNQHIRNFDFVHLFNELGWDYLNEKRGMKFEEETFEFHSIAHKEGFRVIVCQATDSGKIPAYALRRIIQNAVSKLYHENLLIFTDRNKSEQIWQLIDRQPNKPNQFRHINWKSHQDPELLYQRLKGTFFTLSEQEGLTIVDVTQRFKQNFTANAERVTKQFYDKFKTQHRSFLGFIKGISIIGDQEWYASLMLNRLMFCYFIQRKGFLDSNLNYLRDKLNENKLRQGKDQFYSFYKIFLLNLFHQGLGKPHKDVDIPELGHIPYLNGGLFDVHELEVIYEGIQIKDDAFEKIFNFFDEYQWHLDDRPTAIGRDINPDVIGYIFEKYINDRAKMGAYYTREDITDYISKNCIIPYLFDELKRNYPFALNAESEIWQMLKESGDKYIYSAVKYGIPNSEDLTGDLPSEVQAGFDDELAKTLVKDSNSPHLYELREEWNKPAPASIALPTEIYREVIERRNRYKEIKDKIVNGEIEEINDFITYNLDIKQFAQDILETTTDPALIRHFYEALKKVTILDPTCGSGAFLFAAMNILETLYRKCIDRMEVFVGEEGKGKHPAFVKELEQVRRPEHPNLDYFIYKSIILNNLYGVDLMNEAVEIAKLRLFLKLMATVDPDYNKENLGLEPLPDVDFNIRCGNTLVGFANLVELKKGLKWSLFPDKDFESIEDASKKFSLTYNHFKSCQIIIDKDQESFKKAKNELYEAIEDLNEKLNQYLVLNYLTYPYQKNAYETWLNSHQPFHWCSQFYNIVVERGGFDVVIGNPPYVEYNSIQKIYTLKDFRTLKSGNLYSYVIERSMTIQKDTGYNGMIIPISAFCTDRMEILQNYCFSNSSNVYVSNYAERPSKLFEGAERNLSILILKKKSLEKVKSIYTTYYYKWNSSFREFLFKNISYLDAKDTKTYGIIPKVSSPEEIRIIKILRSLKRNINYYVKTSSTKHILYYRNSGGRYWKIITDFQPNFFINGKHGISSRESYLYFNSNEELKFAVSFLNSSLYFWYYIMHSDARTNNPSDLKNFPLSFESLSNHDKPLFIGLCDELMKDLKSNSIMQSAIYRTGDVIFQQFFPCKSKPIIDKIDRLLAAHYGFSEEELDFIINYDIKYRMGIGNGAEEED